ncbi:MAG: thioesterase domain-containing protein [Streptosporangiaceae bacterium]|jgi:surfactin synthase thioesterase subunit
MSVAEATSRWVPLLGRTQPDTLPLFCLPHAGAGASAFRTWPDCLPGVLVLPVQPPGRESRFREAPYERMGPLVAELAAIMLGVAGSRPYAVYGHSLGALVAFETLREIRRRGGTEPVHLFVSGCVALMNRPSRDVLAEVFPGVPLTREIGEFGTPPPKPMSPHKRNVRW